MGEEIKKSKKSLLDVASKAVANEKTTATKKKSVNSVAKKSETSAKEESVKKVTKTTEAKSTANKAREILREQSTAKVAAQIIISNIKYEKEHEFEHEEFLTPEEIATMYPGEEYTPDELAARDIIVTPYSGVEGPSTTRKK